MKVTEKEILEGIDFVFKTLWPRMVYNKKHYDNCKSQAVDIMNLVNNIVRIDDLLNSLSHLESVGLTIATGLIYSLNKDKYVPFDKYTLEHAYRLSIIPNKTIENSYEDYSNRVLNYIKRSKELSTIEDFVLEARKF